MNASPQPQWQPPPAPPPRPPRGAGRVVALVFGILLLVPVLPLLLGGGVLLWADTGGRTDGFVMTGDEDFATPGHALVSERVELEPGADWLPLSTALGTVRVEIGSDDPAADVFVGVAPAGAADEYLDGVSRTVIDDLGFDQPDAAGRLIEGGPAAGPPGSQDFWLASSEGEGARTISWDLTEDPWVLVVMNADGSPGVVVDGRIGAEAPGLTGLAWGVLGAGAVCALLGVLLIVVGARRPAAQPPAGVPGTWAAGPPPAWRPPPQPPAPAQEQRPPVVGGAPRTDERPPS
jgi:hypothetical protein